MGRDRKDRQRCDCWFLFDFVAAKEFRALTSEDMRGLEGQVPRVVA
jgi:hypothetical protein